MAENMIMVYVV